MTKSKHCLADYVEKSGPTVNFGNKDKPGHIRDYGMIIKNGLIIKDVSYVERLDYNLLSASQFCNSGYKVIFQKHFCQLSNTYQIKLFFLERRLKNCMLVIGALLLLIPV